MSMENAAAAPRSAIKQALLQKMLAQKRAAESGRASIGPRQEAGMPLSYAQRRLWYIEQLEGAGPVFNMPLALRLRGRLDGGALAAALDCVLARHPVLSVRFGMAAGEPIQEAVAPAQLARIDLSRDAAPQERVRTLVDQDAQLPFDLTQGPLFRASLLRLTDEEHVLLLNMHHMVSDGWSISILMRELCLAYQAGGAAALAPLPISYADFAHWQLTAAQPLLERQIGYWKETLAGAPALLDLPTDFTRPAQATADAGIASFRLAPDQCAGLAELCRAQRVTPFMVLLTVFYTLLARLSGQQDIVVGTPIANRNRPETEALVGFFANTLALRCRLRNGASWRSVLAQVSDTALSAYEHQDLPFDRLVEVLNPERSLSHSPLFQVLFVLQNGNGGAPMAIDGIAVQALEGGPRLAKFDLSLNMQEDGEGYHGEFIYRTALFEQATMTHFAECYQALLADALRDPDRRWQDLNVFSGERYRSLVHGRSSGESGTTAALFRAQAARTPNATAVQYGEQRISYGQLDELSDRLAQHLLQRGARLDAPVAVYLDRGPHLALAFLAILKAGAAYLPLAPSYPAERIAAIMETAQAELLISEGALAGTAPSAPHTLWIDQDNQWRSEARVASITPHPAALAYIIFTSGSTGRPKGVELTQGGLHNLACWQSKQFGLGVNDRVLQFATLGFDASVWELTMALTSGAALYFAPQAALMPGGPLESTLCDARISAATLPPSVLALMTPDAFPDLTCVVSAGEACSAELAARWSEGRGFFNAYGPSETTVCATSSAAIAPGLRRITIGSAIDRFSVHILDAAMQPVPVGCFGELYIGGDGLARGYRGQSVLTAQAFVPDPFSDRPGARLYRTGDTGRYLANGEIEYRGRVDEQIKLRGFRIELGEIDNALLAISGVREACVVLRRESDELVLLSAFVTLEPSSGLDADAILRALKRSLPDYMLPAQISVLEAMPMTANVKVDRAALARLPVQRARQAGAEAPIGPTETALAEHWQVLLNIGAVGRADNFFALGGHSLLAVKLIERIAQTFGRRLPLSELYRSTSLAELAAAIDDEGADAELVRLTPPGGRTPLYLMHAIGGDIDCYMELARHMPGIALYALRQDPQAMAARAHGIEQLAARYVAVLRAHQPDGPYRLAGWSFGGIVAAEMTAQLRAAGAQVSFLGLVDSGIPALPAPVPGAAQCDLAVSLRAAHGHDDGLRMLGLDPAIYAAGTEAGEAAILLGSHNLAALMLYRRRHCIDGARYYAASEQSEATRHAKLESMRALTGALEHIETIAGTHHSMLREPHVEILAAALTGALAGT